ncbi:MAG TPA: M20/M25/M40 family metallo-hydrolase [Vicinamibacteria bacterium]|nr:M20/M25/M40 family metallo-hydrolase [Vicinamibacteria bacterium]
MKTDLGATALALLAVAASAARAEDEAVARIVGAAMSRGGAAAFLERLADGVGGRITGSSESQAAAELLLATLREAGFANARFEEYPLASRWKRGRASVRISSPVDRPLFVTSYGWTPGTAGRILAPVVDLGAPASDDLSASGKSLRGVAVVLEPRAREGVPALVVRTNLVRAAARAGAAAVLIPVDKPHRLLYTSAFGFYPRGPVPVIALAREDTLKLRRLLAKGPVELALDVENTFETGAASERNVIADIPGSSPDEIVLVGCHFDSWDPADGANDDGSGVAAVLEAARILKSLGVAPRRTLRFAFFSGEEQALLGSRAYVSSHAAELDRLRAVLIMDSGAQRPRGFEIHGRKDLEESARRLLLPLAPLGAANVSLEASFDMDHGPFLAAGVPVLTLWVDDGEYRTHHHAITDTFDKVDPIHLSLGTAVMAATAYLAANAPEPLGRRLGAEEAAELLKRVHLDASRRIVYEE